MNDCAGSDKGDPAEHGPDCPCTRCRGFQPGHDASVKHGADSPARLRPIGLHECRHTFVSLMVAAGRSLEEVGDYVGHSSAYMTDRYRHLLDSARGDAAAALDALLTRGRSDRELRGVSMP